MAKSKSTGIVCAVCGCTVDRGELYNHDCDRHVAEQRQREAEAENRRRLARQREAVEANDINRFWNEWTFS